MSISKKELETIIGIMSSADGGCSYCARNLCHELADDFPEFKEFIKTKFVEIVRSDWEKED